MGAFMSGHEMEVSDIEKYLPLYLSQEKKDWVKKEMEKFYNPQSRGMFRYYSSNMGDVPVPSQGDVWQGIPVFDSDSGDRKELDVILLSNTCDMSSENKRDLPLNISFSPILKLSKLKDLLEGRKVSESVIESKFESIRSQHITNMFYLPASNVLEESVALLDTVYCLSQAKFLQYTEKSTRCSFALSGFYLFLLKLSVHFCRLHEGVNR